MAALQEKFNETIGKVTAQVKADTNDMLKASQKEFAESSNQSIGQILNPLKENIAQLKVTMENGSTAQASHQAVINDQHTQKNSHQAVINDQQRKKVNHTKYGHQNKGNVNNQHAQIHHAGSHDTKKQPTVMPKLLAWIVAIIICSLLGLFIYWRLKSFTNDVQTGTLPPSDSSDVDNNVPDSLPAISDLVDNVLSDGGSSYYEKKVQEEMAAQQTEKQEPQKEELDKLIGKAQELDRSKKELDKAKISLEQAKDKKQHAEAEFKTAKAALGDVEGLQKQAAVIETELPKYDRLNELKLQVSDTEMKLRQNEIKLERNKNEITAKQTELEGLKAENEKLMSAGEKRAELETEKDRVSLSVEDMKELQNKISDLHKREQLVETSRKKYLKLSVEYDEKRKAYEAMDKAYRDEQAGILASDLKDGDECPVCGSTKHPKLAVISDTNKELTKEKLDLAKKISEDAHNAANEGSTDVNVKMSRVDEAKNNITGQAAKIYPEIEIIFDDNVDDTGNDAGRGNVLNIVEITEKLTMDIKEKSQRISEINEEIVSEKRKIARRDELADLIPEAEKKLVDSQSKVTELDKECASLKTKLNSDKEQCDELADGLKYANRKEAAAQMEIFARRANKLQDDYGRTEKTYNDIDKDISAYMAQIETLEKSLQAAPEIELEKLTTEREEVQQKLSSLRKEIENINHRIATNKTQKVNITKRSDELSKLDERFRWMSALSDTASGKVSSKDKIQFETYVQMTYFDRMIKRANKRFLKMSDGQYELERVRESDNKQSQVGLDLCVIDHYNGSRRNVKTLSGGESFMASLSLALGLSDEVQASAGGIQIDTMFVDEGFGSLDTEKTLPQAYNALTSVTEGNKLVGIISHVSELKEKIEKQIVVKKDHTGRSEAELHV